MTGILAAAQIHGLSTQAINAWLMWSAVVLATVSVLAAGLLVALGRQLSGDGEVAGGAMAVLVASILLAWTDPLAVGGPMGWHFLSLVVGLGAAWFATREVLRRRRRTNASAHLAAEIGLGAGVFAATLVIILLIVIAVLMAR